MSMVDDESIPVAVAELPWIFTNGAPVDPSKNDDQREKLPLQL